MDGKVKKRRSIGSKSAKSWRPVRRESDGEVQPDGWFNEPYLLALRLFGIFVGSLKITKVGIQGGG